MRRILARYRKRREPVPADTRCWCGWYPDAATAADQFIGHAATCPFGPFSWIRSPEQVYEMRVLLAAWREGRERVYSDPEILLHDGYDPRWRDELETWLQGVTWAAVAAGWEKP